MDIFQPIIDVFNFIFSILQTIIDGIYGVILVIGNIGNLILSLCRILPQPLYSTFIVFVTLYITIFTYKIFRKG